MTSTPVTTLTIRDDLPARAISPDLWGVFFEDINHAADGGLYAELVQNRSFAYSHADHHGWGPLTAWRRHGRVEIHHTTPLSDRSPNYVRLFGDHGPAWIANDGFDGILIEAGGDYDVTVFARTGEGASARLTLSLETTGGATQTSLVVDQPQWTRYRTRMTGPASAADAAFRLEVANGDTVDVAYASVMPVDTFRRTPNGLRPDLAQAIADIRPRFVRFPGGCVAHGLGLDNLYRWKGTIGDPHERRQDFNLWGYHQSMGLGYFEYFLFCEQIGATPLPILAAGVCCQNLVGGPDAVPLDQLDAYIQDVLDLVEFANGGLDTPWGSRRAELGHPAPFGLRYLGLGNEDKIDATFRNRFEAIFRRVREAHPEIEVVGTAGPSPFGSDYDNGWEFARELGVDVVDEHMYKSPKWFFENTGRYDSYDRSGPHVYVGEYGSWGNRLLNALAEAAFMTGLERNGDVVRLASYAPLLAKKGHTQWVPDLIYFDNERVLPSLNYFVQQLFARTAGTASVQVEVDSPPGYTRPAQGTARLAFQSSGLDVRFENVALDDHQVDDVILSPDGRFETPTSTSADEYTIRATATVLSGDAEGNFAVQFGALGSGDSFEWNFGSWRNRSLTAFVSWDGFRDELLEPRPFRTEIGRPYEIEIRVSDRGHDIEYRLDGEVVQHFRDAGLAENRFSVSVVADSATPRTTVRIVNATDAPRKVAIVNASGRRADLTGAVTLSGEWDAGDAFEPAPCQPQPVEVAGSELTVPAFSFTVADL